MARPKLPDVAPRTMRVHVPTYNNILSFFAASPSGLRGSDAIRQVLYAFGTYCGEQQRRGRVAGSADLRKAEQIVIEMLGPLPSKKSVLEEESVPEEEHHD